MFRLIPIFHGGGPGLIKVIYITFGALVGAVFAPAFCSTDPSCVLIGLVIGAILGWLGWRSADDYKNEKAALARQNRDTDISRASELSQVISFPRWVKATIVGSMCLIIASIGLSVLYYIGVKLLILPAFILLLSGLALFAVGMNAARYYDKQQSR